MNEALRLALENVFQGEVLLAILLAGLYGILVGAIPGLTATMAVALMVPMTFFLSDITAIAAIVTLEAFSIFAGDIPTTLVRIPGTPSSAAYTDDAYTLTQRGQHQRALGVCLVFSVVGGLFGAIILALAAPQLARIAYAFSTAEYFWLYVLGLSCAAIVSHGSKLQGAFALMIGLLLSTVGLSEVQSVPRLTLGQDELITGINFIPAMIGLFGVSEVLRNIGRNPLSELNPPPLLTEIEQATDPSTPTSPPSALAIGEPAETGFGKPWSRLWRRKWHALRSSSLGALIGMTPGAGADIGAWVSYAASKKTSPHPEEYGKGSLDGIADATSANNSALAGAWIPALVLGIPGDSVTAILIGVLLMKNIDPGPEIFANPQQAPLVYGIYITFFLANLLLLPLGYLAIRMGGLLIRIPRSILMPAILLFCIVGAYAINGNSFDILIMLVMGLLGFVLDRFGIPLGPVVLGLILGGELEKSFIQTLNKDSSLTAFFDRKLSFALALTTLLLWLLPLLLRWKKRTSSAD